MVLLFNIACGFCKQCERGLTNYCLTMQPEPAIAGAAYGFADMGPYQGGRYLASEQVTNVAWCQVRILVTPVGRRSDDNRSRQTTIHWWLAPAAQVDWSRAAPLSPDAPATSRHLPLRTLVKVT